MSALLVERARFYGRALRYFLPDAHFIAVLLGLIAVSTAIGLVQVWPMAFFVDSVMAPPANGGRLDQWLPQSLAANRPAQIALLAGSVLLLRLLQELVNMVRTFVNLRIANNGLLRVRCDLFRKLQALNLHYHRSQPLGDSIYRLSNDTTACQGILDVLINTSVAALTLLVMMGIMLSRSIELTLIALAVTPLLLTTNVLYGRILKHRTLAAKEADSRFTSTVHRSMATIGLMQAFGREASEFGKFEHSVAGSIRAWLGYFWQESFYRLWVGLIFGAGGALIFGYGGWIVYRDQYVSPHSNAMTVGDLMVFLTYLGMFYDPLCKLSGASANIQGSVAGAERVFEILDRDLMVTDAANALSLPRQPRTLHLDAIGFRYDAGRPVLRGVDVEIRPGDMVAFVGSSGVGKSTLLNLLPRFYDPTEGALCLDGFDVRGIKLADLRRHIALVLQESVILPTTIAENIAYGRPDATPAEIRRAAEMAGALEFIESLPQGFYTEITEGGQNLSGGQRQRLSIARALLTEAPIIVLDEPTSALDPHHERLIVETLRRLKRERTIIVVSHRLSTVVDCDTIYVMDEGQIAERGTHDRLLEQGGLYHEMAEQQLLVPEHLTEARAA